MTTKANGLLGIAEIAELYSISKVTAGTWSRRRDFPNPVSRLAMGPVWSKADVIAWRQPKPDGKHISIECAWCQSVEFSKIERLPLSENDSLYICRGEIICRKCSKRTGVNVFWYFDTEEVRFNTYRKEEKKA
jgi:predicted DNA-binding transcriptional regulator AlpA